MGFGAYIQSRSLSLSIIQYVKRAKLLNIAISPFECLSVLLVVELRNVSIVLVHTKRDHTVGLLVSIVIGLVLSTMVLIIGKLLFPLLIDIKNLP